MKTLIAIPCLDTVNAEFFRSLLEMEKPGVVGYQITVQTLIYHARNEIALYACENDFDRVLWLDSDMVFPKDTMIRLSEDMEGREFVSGLYFKRKPPYSPTIFAKCGTVEVEPGQYQATAAVYDKYPDGIFPIAACGFGCVMTTTDLIKRVMDKYGMPFSPMYGFGEDLTFCMRVAQTGGTMYCDSRIKCGHIATFISTEETWKNADLGRREACPPNNN